MKKTSTKKRRIEKTQIKKTKIKKSRDRKDPRKGNKKIETLKQISKNDDQFNRARPLSKERGLQVRAFSFNSQVYSRK